MAQIKTKFSKKINKTIYYLVYSHKEIDRTGQPKYKTTWIKIGPSKTEAFEAKKQFEKKYRHNTEVLDTNKTGSLHEFITSEFLPWCNDRKSDKTYERTKLILGLFMSFIGDIKLKDVKEKHIQKYLTWRRKKSLTICNSKKKELSNNTLNKELTCINECFEKAKRWNDGINQNPCSEISKLKTPKGKLRFFSKEEIQIILENTNEYIERLFLFGIYTGMRLSEILNTKISNIDLENNLIYIVNDSDFTTKDEDDRSIPIPPEFRDLLAYYIHTWVDYSHMTVQPRTKRQNTYLFCNREGNKLTTFKKAFERLLSKSNIVDASIHTMRHTYASHLVMSGVDLRTVQELLGHANFKTTLIYAHLSPEHKENAVSKLTFKN